MPRVLDGAEPGTKEDKTAAKHESEHHALPETPSEQSLPDEHSPHEEDEGRHEINGTSTIDFCGCCGRTHE